MTAETVTVWAVYRWACGCEDASQPCTHPDGAHWPAIEWSYDAQRATGEDGRCRYCTSVGRLTGVCPGIEHHARHYQAHLVAKFPGGGRLHVDRFEIDSHEPRGMYLSVIREQLRKRAAVATVPYNLLQVSTGMRVQRTDGELDTIVDIFRGEFFPVVITMESGTRMSLNWEDAKLVFLDVVTEPSSPKNTNG